MRVRVWERERESHSTAKWDEDKKQIKEKVSVWDRKREMLQEEDIEIATEKKLREGDRERASERLSERQRELDRVRKIEREIDCRYIFDFHNKMVNCHGVYLLF